MARIIDDHNEPVVVSDSPVDRVIQVIYVIVGIIEALLGLRLVLRMLGASQASGFVDFIYSWSYPLVQPFFGVFNTIVDTTVGRLELETLLAMAVYALVGYLLAALVRVLRP